MHSLLHLGLLACAPLALLPGHAQAQQETVLPAGFDYENSGGSWEFLPVVDGINGVRAMQVVERSSVGVDSRSITQIEFRHTSFWNQSYASTHNVRISLGYTQLDPGELPVQFASIPDAPLTDVFVGQLNIPASTTKAIPEPWTLPITLQTPWLYDPGLGNLVIELESSYVSGDLRSWPGDVHARTLGGAGFQRTGVGCDTLTSQLSPFGSDLTPGGSVSFYLERSPLVSLFGKAMIGFPAPSTPIDLGPLGAPGCVVRAQPRARQDASVIGQLHKASGFVTWAIPPMSSLIGLAFDHQVYLASPNSNALGVIVSNSHRGYIGSSAPIVSPSTNTLHGAFGATTGNLPANPIGWILRLTTD